MSLDKNGALEIFRQAGAYLKGHFRLSSGLHSDTYLEKARVLQYPKYASMLCGEIADRFKDHDINVVVGPAVGAITLAFEVARQLNGPRAIFAEREAGKMRFRRGFAIAENENVLVVEDIITTGTSVQEVVDLVRTTAGHLVGAAVLVDRSGGKVDLGVPLEALATLEINAWSEDECPLCRQGIPLTTRGSHYL